MKISAFILSIFIFTIALLPCEDGIDGAINETESVSSLETGSHNHSQDKEDGCTAFCVCQCCGTPITIPSLVLFSEIKNTVLYSYSFHYSSLYSFDYSNGVWHPPTLS